MASRIALYFLLILFCLASFVTADESLRSSLTFHASFDHGADADFSKGDGKIYTSADMKRASIDSGITIPQVSVDSNGRWGGSLDFADKTNQVVLFKGKNNMPYSTTGFDATISFWLLVDPENGLKPGYVDPIQITEKQWNDAAIWVDFSKDEKPRHFRLGVFSNRAFWNPDEAEWDDVPVDKRPRVDVTKPPFAAGRWTHVGITIKGLNSGRTSVSALYLDGKTVGQMIRASQFTWNVDNVAIMLGIAYIGKIDDFAIFDRAFSEKEIDRLMKTNGGVTMLK